ncbi:MAG: hypothetical protein QXU67_06855 [Candidatus Bathyarchaeia archaeon]
MNRKPVTDRLRELQIKVSSRSEILKILYLEKYPAFEITSAMNISSSELQTINEELKLFLLRCPVGHRFLNDPPLHAEDAHYCVECKRWFNEASLKDEIDLEIKRLKEKEGVSPI